MLLTDEERRRFAEYCLSNAETNRGLAVQMAKINVPAFVIEKYNKEAEAFEIVGKNLLATEGAAMGG